MKLVTAVLLMTCISSFLSKTITKEPIEINLSKNKLKKHRKNSERKERKLFSAMMFPYMQMHNMHPGGISFNPLMTSMLNPAINSFMNPFFTGIFSPNGLGNMYPYNMTLVNPQYMYSMYPHLNAYSMMGGAGPMGPMGAMGGMGPMGYGRFGMNPYGGYGGYGGYGMYGRGYGYGRKLNNENAGGLEEADVESSSKNEQRKLKINGNRLADKLEDNETNETEKDLPQ